MDTATTNIEADNPSRPRALRRPIQGRLAGGVAAGIAAYLGVDATVVRLGFAVLALIGGAAIPAYVAGWLLIPEQGSDRSIAGAFISSHQTRSR
jgi:phage shock protein C